MSQGPKPGTMHGAGVGVPAPVVQTHPLGHGSHACTCFYVVTHTIHHILRCGDGGHLPVCGFGHSYRKCTGWSTSPHVLQPLS